MNLLLLMTLIAILIGVNLIAYLIQPNDILVQRFWLSVAWLNFLIIINWIASAAIFSGSTSSEKSGNPGSAMGALPAINITILFFSIISFILLLIFFFSLLSWKAQLIFQTIIVISCIVITLIMMISTKAAAIGSESKVSKIDLLNECNRLLRLFNNNEKSELLKNTINYISYKMPHPSKLSQDSLVVIHGELKSIVDEDNTILDKTLNKIKKL